MLLRGLTHYGRPRTITQLTSLLGSKQVNDLDMHFLFGLLIGIERYILACTSYTREVLEYMKTYNSKKKNNYAINKN